MIDRIGQAEGGRFAAFGDGGPAGGSGSGSGGGTPAGEDEAAELWLDPGRAGAFDSPGLRVLAALAAGDAECMTDVGRRCGLPLADTFRVVRDLEAAGLVVTEEGPDGRLAPRLLRRRVTLGLVLPNPAG
ncbi:MAG TPA: helix-turn-helix domain-containing protein [Azospirillaceae bacterium]|nr:helix-turn-helix domain-containing protein [Azospirillaceae bacterium]